MKTYIVFVLLIALACSNDFRVYTDYDPAYDLGTFLTFDWLDKTNIEAGKNPVYYNELNDKRIKTAVQRELDARGYVHSETNAELIIHYHIMVDDKETTVPEHEADTYGPYWQQAPRYVVSYKEGTLIIDVMNSKNNLIWRGSAAAPIEEIYSPEKVTKLINSAVKKMFKSFPTTKRKQAQAETN
jgi:hypothetical protein